MPTYCFLCKKCSLNFESLCNYDERKQQKCPKCNKKRWVDTVISGAPTILGPTAAKKGNMEWAGPYNFEKAQKESAAARDLATKKGLDPYRNINDLTENNFNPENW